MFDETKTTPAAPTCAGCGSSDLLLTDGDGTVFGLCRSCERLQEVETRAEPIRPSPWSGTSGARSLPRCQPGASEPR